MKNTTKLIVYDWNGTLLDDSAIVLESLNDSLKKYGYAPVSFEALRTHYQIPLRAMYMGFGIPKEFVIENIRALTEAFLETYRILEPKAPLREHTLDLLTKVRNKNIQQCILSNHITPEIKNALNRLEIADFFSEVVANPSRAHQHDNVPKGVRFRSHLATLPIEPQDVIIIGDTPEETQIAHALGAMSIAITGGYSTPEALKAEKPEHLVHSFSELLKLFSEMGVL